MYLDFCDDRRVGGGDPIKAGWQLLGVGMTIDHVHEIFFKQVHLGGVGVSSAMDTGVAVRQLTSLITLH